MIHKKPPGLPWLVGPRMRPPKRMIVGPARGNITKNDEIVKTYGDRRSGVFRRLRRSPMVFDDLSLRIVSPSRLRLLCPRCDVIHTFLWSPLGSHGDPRSIVWYRSEWVSIGGGGES